MPSPYPHELLVMADYGASPVWVRSATGTGEKAIPLADLDISTGLRDRLGNWAHQYDQLAHTNYEWASFTEQVGWITAGRALSQELQHELGRDFNISYFEE